MNFFLSKLDLYILKKFIGTFFFCILLIILIVIVFDISEKIEDFINHHVALHEIVFDYYLNFIPYFINLFSPLFTFISVIFFTSRMASRTEIVAMLSAGISFRRLLRPYMIGAGLIAALSFVLGNYLIPVANRTRLSFESKYVGSQFRYENTNTHRWLAPNVACYIMSYDNLANTGTKFTIEKFKDGDMVYKLTANEIQWDSIHSKWSIRDYWIRYRTKVAVSPGSKNAMWNERIANGARLDTTLNISPKEFTREENLMASMTTPELKKYIAGLKLKGSGDVQKYEVERMERFAYPFATFILTLIGVALSSRKVRGGIGLHLGLGIGLSFIFIFLMKVFEVAAVNAGLPAAIVWMSDLIFLAICLQLLRKAPK